MNKMVIVLLACIATVVLAVSDSENCPANCMQCKTNAESKCVTCYDGYFLNEDDLCSSCVSEYFVNCGTCNSSVCNDCEDFYGNELDKHDEIASCFSCTADYGEFCTDCNATDCLACVSGYRVSFDEDQGFNTCSDCAIDNCDTCNATECLTCNSGYLVNEDKECSECGVDGCGVCYNNTETGCDSCADGYYTEDDGFSCIPCTVANCSEGHVVFCNEEANTMAQCDLCKEGFYLSEENHFPRPDNCTKCEVENCATCAGAGEHCLTCMYDHFLTINKTECVLNGTQCYLDNGKGMSCDDGFTNTSEDTCSTDLVCVGTACFEQDHCLEEAMPEWCEMGWLACGVPEDGYFVANGSAYVEQCTKIEWAMDEWAVTCTNANNSQLVGECKTECIKIETEEADSCSCELDHVHIELDVANLLPTTVDDEVKGAIIADTHETVAAGGVNISLEQITVDTTTAITEDAAVTEGARRLLAVVGTKFGITILAAPWEGAAISYIVQDALNAGTFKLTALTALVAANPSRLIDTSMGVSVTGQAAVIAGHIPPAPTPAPTPKKKKSKDDSNKLSGSALAAAIAVPVVFGVVCIAVIIGIAVAMGAGGSKSTATKKPAAAGPQKVKSAAPTEALSSDVAEGEDEEEEEEGSGEAPESSDAGEGSEA